MQTLTIKVKDNFMTEFMNMINNVKDNVIVQQDENLEIDPYFYERQKKLQQIRNNIKSGKMRTHDFESSMDELIKDLES